jgi:deoxyribonuclease-4
MDGVPVVVATPGLEDGDPCSGHAADITLLNSLIGDASPAA